MFASRYTSTDRWELATAAQSWLPASVWPCWKGRNFPSPQRQMARVDERGLSWRRHSHSRLGSSRTGMRPCPDSEPAAKKQSWNSRGVRPHIPSSRPVFLGRTAWLSSCTLIRRGMDSVSRETLPAAALELDCKKYCGTPNCFYRLQPLVWHLADCKNIRWGRFETSPRSTTPAGLRVRARLSADGETEDIKYSPHPQKKTGLTPSTLAIRAWLTAARIATASNLAFTTSSAL